MASDWIIFISAFIVGGLIASAIVFFVWWLKTRKIRKQAPSFEGTEEDWRTLNFDQKVIERRALNGNGITERRDRKAPEEASRASSGEGEDAEISRLREEIRRKERELGRR